MKFGVLPPPESLKEHIECVRIAEHTDDTQLAINVCLNGLPGIVFQHQNGHPPVENIITHSGLTTSAPTFYVYGQMTEPSVMHHKKGAFTTIQFILKPHALQTLLSINASVLTNTLVEMTNFSADDLNIRLLDASSHQTRIALLTNFLLAKLNQAKMRDLLIEESLRLIHKNIGSVTIKDLLEALSISERQFERRFNQTIGVSPHFYIRIKRFNEAIALMQTRQFHKLTDIAHALCYYDQSHFIRDIKAFSGITPKTLSQKAGEFHPDQKVISY